MMADLPEFVHRNHVVQDEYPAGSTVRFGRGYTFASKPNGPEEVILHLTFHNGLFYVTNRDNLLSVNKTDLPGLNILRLHDFYTSLLQYGQFMYKHPFKGPLVCRFNKPLIMPKVRTDTPGAVGAMQTGNSANPVVNIHQTEAFDLEFITVP